MRMILWRYNPSSVMFLVPSMIKSLFYYALKWSCARQKSNIVLVVEVFFIHNPGQLDFPDREKLKDCA